MRVVWSRAHRPARRRRARPSVAARGDGRARARVPDGGRRHALRRRARAPVPARLRLRRRRASGPCCRRCPPAASRRWSRGGAIPAMPPGAPLGGFHWIAASTTPRRGQRRARAGRARRAERRRPGHGLERGAGRRRAGRVPHRALRPRRATPSAGCASSRATAPAARRFRAQEPRAPLPDRASGRAREQRFDVELPEDPARGRRALARAVLGAPAQAGRRVVRDGGRHRRAPGQRGGAAARSSATRRSASCRSSRISTGPRAPSGWWPMSRAPRLRGAAAAARRAGRAGRAAGRAGGAWPRKGSARECLVEALTHAGAGAREPDRASRR